MLGGVVPDGSLSTPAAWKGNRHDWNILVGEIAPEVLEWLRADPVLTPGTDEFKAMQVTFTGSSTTVKTEEKRKWIKAGAMDRCCSGSMCRRDLSSGFPSPSGRLVSGMAGRER